MIEVKKLGAARSSADRQPPLSWPWWHPRQPPLSWPWWHPCRALREAPDRPAPARQLASEHKPGGSCRTADRANFCHGDLPCESSRHVSCARFARPSALATEPIQVAAAVALTSQQPRWRWSVWRAGSPLNSRRTPEGQLRRQDAFGRGKVRIPWVEAAIFLSGVRVEPRLARRRASSPTPSHRGAFLVEPAHDQRTSPIRQR